MIFLRLAQDVVSIKGNGAPKNKVFMLFGAVPACLMSNGYEQVIYRCYWLLQVSQFHSLRWGHIGVWWLAAAEFT